MDIARTLRSYDGKRVAPFSRGQGADPPRPGCLLPNPQSRRAMRRRSYHNLLVILGLTLAGACAPDTPESAAAPENAMTEAEAWSKAYDRLLARNPNARVFDEMMAQRFPEMSRSELIRTWDAEKSRRLRRHHPREAKAIEGLAAHISARLDGKVPPLELLADVLDRSNWYEWGPPYYPGR